MTATLMPEVRREGAVRKAGVEKRKKITEARTPQGPSFKGWVVFDLFGVHE